MGITYHHHEEYNAEDCLQSEFDRKESPQLVYRSRIEGRRDAKYDESTDQPNSSFEAEAATTLLIL